MVDYASSFHTLRNLIGNPVLTCIKPRSQWVSIPSGYTFSTGYDCFVNITGAQWYPSSTADLNAADYVTVAFLPGAGDAELALSAGGLIDDGTVFGRVLPADMATVDAAQWLEIDGCSYNKTGITPQPRGAALWYAVRMDKRK